LQSTSTFSVALHRKSGTNHEKQRTWRFNLRAQSSGGLDPAVPFGIIDDVRTSAVVLSKATRAIVTDGVGIPPVRDIVIEFFVSENLDFEVLTAA
jgi:hypothetical protein